MVSKSDIFFIFYFFINGLSLIKKFPFLKIFCPMEGNKVTSTLKSNLTLYVVKVLKYCFVSYCIIFN